MFIRAAKAKIVDVEHEPLLNPLSINSAAHGINAGDYNYSGHSWAAREPGGL